MRQLVLRGWSCSLFSLVPGTAPSKPDQDALRDLCEQVELHDFRVSRAVRQARLARDLLLGRAYYSSFFVSPAAVARFREWLTARNPDVILVSQLYMHPYVPPDCRSLSVLDCHNVEANRLATMASALGTSPRGIVARFQVDAVRSFEAEVVRSVARALTVSRSEFGYFDRIAPGRIDLVPNGVDCESYTTRARLPQAPSILFMGSMDYTPNVDAFAHLVRDILPHLRRRDATLTVVGSNPRRGVYAIARESRLRTEVVGHVESTRPYLEGCRLLVVPLRFGGGTRLKILEALAQGVPVVTTSVGCEGLDLEPERDLVVADDPQDFAERVDELLDDDAMCLRLAEQGRTSVEARYDWHAIGSRLHEALTKI